MTHPIFIIGHSKKSQGTSLEYATLRSEWEFVSIIGDRLREHGADVRHRTKDLYEALNAEFRADNGVRLIELHLDSRTLTGGKETGGLGVHYPTSRLGRELSDTLGPTVMKAIGIPWLGSFGWRFSWARVALDRAGDIVPAGEPIAILNKTTAPAMVLELGNAKNYRDLRSIVQSLDSGALLETLLFTPLP